MWGLSGKDTVEVISSASQGFFTIILAVLTFFYLRETKKSREISEKILKLEWAAKIVVDIDSKYEAGSEKLNINNEIIINNTGKTVALNVKGKIIVKFDSGESTSYETNIVPEISSSYKYPFSFNIQLDKTDLKAIKQLSRTQKLDSFIPKKTLPEATAKVIIEYANSVEGEKITKEFSYKYIFNQWTKL